MLKWITVFLLCIVNVNCQNWGTRACLVNQHDYYMNIIQKAISKVENNFKWCNFKLNDVNREINERLFKWHAQGTANYTNGFLTRFRSIDVSNILSHFTTRTVDGTSEHVVSVNGLLNFRNVYVGYDVVANIDGFDTKHFTGVFPFNLVAIRCAIITNLITKEVTVTAAMASTTPTLRRMTFFPETTISELLSRHFLPGHISFSDWGEKYIAPLILEFALKTELPEIRYDNIC